MNTRSDLIVYLHQGVQCEYKTGNSVEFWIILLQGNCAISKQKFAIISIFLLHEMVLCDFDMSRGINYIKQLTFYREIVDNISDN